MAKNKAGGSFDAIPETKNGGRYSWAMSSASESAPTSPAITGK